MRYKTYSPSPRYIGGVDEYDIYITRGGNVIARYGNRSDEFLRPKSDLCSVGDPLSVGDWTTAIRQLKAMRLDSDVAERIVAMLNCFAPDLCGPA